MTSADGWDREFRRSASRWWVTLLGSTMVLVCLACVLAPGPSPGHAANGTISTPARVVYGLGGVILAVMVVRWVRAGIFTSQSGVLFRNVMATTFIAWSDVERFERPPRYGTMRKAGLRAVRRDGSIIASSIYQAGPFNSSDFADNVVGQLDELRLRAGGPATADR